MNLNPDFLESYIELEIAIREQMIHLCSETCGLCTACCCRADICEEATESAFLSLLLKKQGLSVEKMDDRFGWLDVHGCLLEYGRPPICYAYYCDELLARLPDEENKLVAQTLGQLLFHVGQNAIGDAQLSEIVNSKSLKQVDWDTVFQRLEEAQEAFEVIGKFMQSGRLSAADCETLAVIEIRDDF